MAADKNERKRGSVRAGVLWALVLHALVQGGLWYAQTKVEGLERVQTWALFFGGAVQLLYLLPLARWFRKRDRRLTARGVWLVMALTLVLNLGFGAIVYFGSR